MDVELDGWYRRTEERYIYLIKYKNGVRGIFLYYTKSTGTYRGYMIYKGKHLQFESNNSILMSWKDNWLDSLPLPSKIEI